MPTQSTNQARTLARIDRDAPSTDLQRRANGHDVAGQLAQNAQFKRQMIAQMRGQNGQEDTSAVLSAAAQGVQGSGGALPYLATIQKSFGHYNVSSVQAFVGGQAKTASEAIGAEAYATGNSVAFRGSPTLHTAAHEAAHIVQQRAGVQLSGGVGQVGDKYECHADAVADRVVQGKSAADLLDQFTGMQAPAEAGVQRKEASGNGLDDAQFDHLRGSIAKTNVYLRGVLTVLKRYGHHPAVGRAGQQLQQLITGLAKHAHKATAMKLCGRLVTVIGGLTRICEANNLPEFFAACADTAGHIFMGFTPLTAILDVILTAAFGPDWPSKTARTIAILLERGFSAYFAAWEAHQRGTGEALIPAGTGKM